MSKRYYMRHVNASGRYYYKRLGLIGLLMTIAELYTGESITVIRSAEYDPSRSQGELERKLNRHPHLYQEL